MELRNDVSERRWPRSATRYLKGAAVTTIASALVFGAMPAIAFAPVAVSGLPGVVAAAETPALDSWEIAVSGTARDASGKPISGGRIEAWHSSEGMIAAAKVGSDGTFRVVYERGYGPNITLKFVNHDPDSTLLARWKGADSTRSWELKFSAPESGVEYGNNDLTMVQAARYRGKITDDAGKPVKNAAVNLISADYDYDSQIIAQSDSAGQYSLLAPAGKKYHMSVSTEARYLLDRPYEVAPAGGKPKAGSTTTANVSLTYGGRLAGGVSGTSKAWKQAAIILQWSPVDPSSGVKAGDTFVRLRADGSKAPWDAGVLPEGKYRVGILNSDMDFIWHPFTTDKSKATVFTVVKNKTTSANFSLQERTVAAAPVAFDDTKAKYTVPTSNGVKYKVNGKNVRAGSYTATRGTKYVFTATSMPGYALSGTKSWSFTASKLATAKAPVFSAKNHTVSIPKVSGVTYKLNGKTVASGKTFISYSKAKVTAHAASGYRLTGTTSWTKELRTVVKTVKPVVKKPAKTVTIPKVTGASYLVNGVPVKAGTVKLSAKQAKATVTVTVKPASSKFVLSGTTKWITK